MAHGRAFMRYVAALLRGVFLLASMMLLLTTQGTGHVFASPARASTKNGQQTIPKRPGYAGNAACFTCHRQLAHTYAHTSHFLTSQRPSAHSILGSFAPGSNKLWIARPAHDTRQPRLFFRMDRKPDGFYETAVAEMGSRKLTHSERIAVVIGSSVRGQTYLYWHGNHLNELPVSYWTVGHQWINSPGYVDGTANFARRADPRCMECHATYIRALSLNPRSNLYQRNSLVLGISCETCHGPGAEHVALERGGSARQRAKGAAAILNPSHFSRARQVELCALCHSGSQRKELLPAFSYVPGQPLDRYFAPAPLTDTTPDVHANEVALLKLSRCYLDSPSMTCSTCHNVHARMKKPAAGYSKVCMRCHEWKSCGEAKKLGSVIQLDCVDCHMPMVRTRAIVSVTAARALHTSIRTHWIKVYPGAAIPTVIRAKLESENAK